MYGNSSARQVELRHNWTATTSPELCPGKASGSSQRVTPDADPKEGPLDCGKFRRTNSDNSASAIGDALTNSVAQS